jgi:hypothetical protein
MLKGAIDADTNILTRIIQDNGNSYNKLVRKGKPHMTGLMDDFGGGRTLLPVSIILSYSLSKFKKGYKGEHTLGGVFLHELLWHIHPSRYATKGFEPVDSNTMRDLYNLKPANKPHPPKMFGDNTNRKIPNIKL